MADENERGTVFNNGYTIVGVPVAELSDKNRARLAHLEAIEALQDEIRLINTPPYCYSERHRSELTGSIDRDIHDLIREGMKDNG